MNSLTIIGNLTADPELRTIPSGVNVCTFTVAVNRRYTTKDSEQTADYFKVAAWRQLGENCARYLTKGKKVAVRGEVSARAYETKEGGIRASLEVNAYEVEFLSPVERQSVTLPAEYTASSDQPDTRGSGWTELEDASGDLPF